MTWSFSFEFFSRLRYLLNRAGDRSSFRVSRVRSLTVGCSRYEPQFESGGVVSVGHIPSENTDMRAGRHFHQINVLLLVLVF